jgi:hypothetical protein
MNLESEFQSAIASQILRGDGRYGYQIILQFSRIFLVEGLLTIDCPTQDDADAIVQTFGLELHRIIEQKLPRVERIEIQASGETAYPPHPPGCIFWT